MPIASSDHPAPRAVIHLGARRGERLQEFRDRGAEQILLIEPETGQAADLKRRLGNQPGVRILAAAPGTEDGRGELVVMSFPVLNAMAEPAPILKALYPGLRQERRQEVEIVSPTRLLDELGSDLSPLLLVVETPGTELAQLEAWKAAGVLERINLLELKCGEEPLYAGAAGRVQIEAWLAAEGFRLIRRDLSDPDWPVLHMQIDGYSRALARAESRVAELEDLLKTETDKAATLDKTVVQLRERTARLQEEAARDRHDALNATEELGVTLRMNNRLQADLRDLQTRHAASLAEKAEQEALLRQLASRLREAAQHLHELPLLDGDPDPAVVSQAADDQPGRG